MQYKPIRAYDNYIQANMEMALLLQAGIDCHIKDEYTITIDPLLSPALGGMKLMVATENIAAALDLLNNSYRLYLQSIPCPTCGERSLEQVTTVTYFKSFAGRVRSMLLNGQEQEVRKTYSCTNCDSTFTTLPENMPAAE